MTTKQNPTEVAKPVTEKTKKKKSFLLKNLANEHVLASERKNA